MTSLAKADSAAALNDFAREINATHGMAKAHAEMAVVLAVRVGLLCVQAKEIVGHGKFGEWMASECPDITDRTARKYMALAIKSESGSDLPCAELVAPGFAQRVADEAGYRDEVIARVRASVGDGSLTQLYHEYGVVADRRVAKPTRPESAVRGIYTPHAARVDFDRALRQTLTRVPLEQWSAEMCAAWVRELQPIAELHAQLVRRIARAA